MHPSIIIGLTSDQIALGSHWPAKCYLMSQVCQNISRICTSDVKQKLESFCMLFCHWRTNAMVQHNSACCVTSALRSNIYQGRLSLEHITEEFLCRPMVTSHVIKRTHLSRVKEAWGSLMRSLYYARLSSTTTLLSGLSACCIVPWGWGSSVDGWITTGRPVDMLKNSWGKERVKTSRNRWIESRRKHVSTTRRKPTFRFLWHQTLPADAEMMMMIGWYFFISFQFEDISVQFGWFSWPSVRQCAWTRKVPWEEN